MAIISTLPEYVEQNHDSLLRDALMGAESAKMFTLQTGVKTKTALNLLNTSIVFQDGMTCGFNADGTSTISQRTITAPLVKVNMNFCEKTLLNTALQHDVRVQAGQKALPFEQDFTQDVVENVASGVEKMVWQGDTESEDNTLKWTDGLIKILNASDGITKAENKLTHASGKVKDAVDAVVKAIPTPVLKKAVIFMGYDYFRAYVMELQALNLYHNSGEGLDKGETYYQGTNIKIKAVSGLDDTNTIVAGNPENFFYGTDLQGDEEKFDFWYSKDNQEFRLAVQFAVGVQVAFPNQCVISAQA